jgi:hypothetical protein
MGGPGFHRSEEEKGGGGRVEEGKKRLPLSESSLKEIM